MKEIIERILMLKQTEQVAKTERMQLETQLADMIPGKHEGTTNKEDSGYKVTVTRKLKRELDHEAYLAIKDSLPVIPVVYRPGIVLNELRHLEAIDPALTAQFITTKPAKAAVKISEV